MAWQVCIYLHPSCIIPVLSLGINVTEKNFCHMDICDKPRMDLAMFTYIYLNVDEC